MNHMTGTQFFMKNQVKARLHGNSTVDGNHFYFVSGDYFVIEMIDRPYRCTFAAGEGVVSVKLYIRSELGMYDEGRGDLNLTAFAGESEPMIWGSDRIDRGEEMIVEYFHAANALCATMTEAQRAEFAEANGEHEGFVVKFADDELQVRRVAGKRRPSLLCTTLFDGDIPVRPYSDEIRSAWQQTKKDFATLLQEAEDGDEEAMERIALLYLNGSEECDVAQCYEQAAFWFGKLVEADDAAGQFQLGKMYLRGLGVDKNPQQALRLLSRAVENDCVEAVVFAEAAERILDLEPSAEAGNDTAAADLAKVYLELAQAMEDGEDFFALSFRLAEKAAEAEASEAFWVLAQIYEQGLGKTEDFERALAYYQRGCALGHAGCMHSIGCLYLQGDYLISDVEQGIELCMKAAEQGYGPAMLTIANCYQFGNGVPSSMKTAIEWFEKYLEIDDDAELRHMIAHYRTIAGLTDDTGMETPFEMVQEDNPFGGFSIFGDDPFASGGFGGGADFGGMFGGGQSFVSEQPAYEASIPMFSDDLLWTRLRAEAGDESAIALLAELEALEAFEE